jgi:Alpha amylase, catalytic domain
MPRYPALLEINTRPWLGRLSADAGKPVTLADVGEDVLDGFARDGFDWIWLLSVWQLGPKSRAVSRQIPSPWRAECEAALPDLTDVDIAGSGFAIADYKVNEDLGGAAALAGFRARLAKRGIKLMLDFVPNHTGLDSPWIRTQPDFYIRGSEAEAAAAPGNYWRAETDQGPRILAHGRDPNFPGWTDTLQLNYANPALQAAQMAKLAAVAKHCDGLRCDMAMLLLPEVFHRTWGLTPEPFWPKAIAAVRQAHPGFTFMAEVYWGLEWELQQQGFDYCYDKRLYDRLRHADAAQIRGHFAAGLDYQDKLARFLENHDEPRAAATFPWLQHQAAAVVTFLAPGLRFFQQGQAEGAKVRLPTHLSRGPVETPDPEIAAFYAKLLEVLKANDAIRNGAWSLLDPRQAWPGNPTAEGFIAYAWQGAAGARYVVVVNYTDHQGQCDLRLPFAGLANKTWRLTDEMGSELYDRDGAALIAPGLFIDLGPWRFNVFKLESWEG